MIILLLKAKCLSISTGGPLVALVNISDAKTLNLHDGDRVLLKGNNKEVISIIDTTSDFIPKGTIGLFYETSKALNVKSGRKIYLSVTQKPESLMFIREKLHGKKLTYEKIKRIVDDISLNKLSDIEITYFVSACYPNKLSLDETVALANAMVDSGDRIKFDDYPIMDVHCVGGVAGNRTTMLIVPIIAAYGLKIPKTSSRAITSPSGTADTMEVLSEVTFSTTQLKKIVGKTNGCIAWGGSMSLAPADDKIIRVESPLSIDSEGQMLASILAKKKSVASTHVLIDIPVGRGSKINNINYALRLRKKFLFIGSKMNMKIKVLITDGTQPIGNGIGAALEARDILWSLERDERAPKDLELKSLMMSAHMLSMAKKLRFRRAFQTVKKILDSGSAHEKMLEIIKAQGLKVNKSSAVKVGKYSFDIYSKKSGKVRFINNQTISKIARAAGAPLDKGAGLYLYKHKKDFVRKKEVIYTIYSENKQKLDYAAKLAEQDEFGYEIR